MGLLPAAAMVLWAAAYSVTAVASGTVELTGMLTSFGVFALLALGATVSSRSGGPDLSASGITMLSWYVGAAVASAGGGVWLSLAAALAIGLVSGAICGVLIRFVRVPAWAITLLCGILSTALALLLPGTTEVIHAESAGIGLLALVLVLTATIISVIYIAATAAGRQVFILRGAERPRLVRGYLLSGVMYSAAGFAMLSSAGFYSPIAADNTLEISLFIVLIYAALMSSRMLDNRIMPVPWVLLGAATWSGITRGMLRMGYPGAVVTLAQTLIVVGLLVIAYISHMRDRNTIV